MRLKDTLIGLFVVALVGVGAFVWFSGAGLKRAPEVEFTLLTGERLKLSALHGQPVLVTFWATTCVGCRREIPHLVELYNALHARGFELVAVAMQYDPPLQVQEFARQKGLPYRVALDIDASAARAFFDVRLTPTSFVIAPDGRIVFEKIGEFEPAAMRALIEKLLTERRTG